jgi:hypothetical protein
MIDQPYYIIDFSAVSCMFEIRVNDISVIWMNIPGQVSTRIPINFSISKTGIQEVTVKLLPILGGINLSENTEFKYTIQCFDASNNLSFKSDILEYTFPKIKKNDLLPIKVKVSTFNIEVPYVLSEPWKEGEILTKVKEVKKKLIKSYLEIGNLIANSNFELFKEKIKNRETLMAKSMYLSSKESTRRLDSLIYDFKNGFNNVKLSNDVVVIYSAYNKKASLKRANGEHALSFINVNKKEQIMLDIEFYLPKGSDEFDII